MQERIHLAYAFVMRFIRYRPRSPLDACVDSFWWSQREQSDRHAEHMLPSGRAQLIFALHDTPLVCRAATATTNSLVWRGGVVHGPQWSYYRAGAKPAGAVIGVSFHAGAAGAILGVPISEVADRHVLIEDLWGSDSAALREQLLAASSPAACFRILERALTARLKRPLLIHPAIAQALACPVDAGGRYRVADIQRDTGYSCRHFNALFRAAVGLTPKHFYRVQRFAIVLRQLAKGDRQNLADLAVASGYSDQAHMTREFREFAGVTPTQYRPRNSASIFHQRVPHSGVAPR